ncbi:hypothetical protein AMTR_s00097p00151190 [Amborella trichopoda]|uniref:Uncharacterized protein n=1 Tax=Amborella trichopoda TaxID=13333 RepID=W1P486_AMBTC|nr:hypothetical protein AMTR_s00097p00151190 [Amborella trichopoda]
MQYSVTSLHDDASDKVVPHGSQKYFPTFLVHGGSIDMPIPLSGKVEPNVAISPVIQLGTSSIGKVSLTLTLSLSSSFSSKVSVQYNNPSREFSPFFWFAAALSIAGHKHCSVMSLVLLVIAKMYPFFHRCASRKAKMSRIIANQGFDPLLIVPVALVVINEEQDQNINQNQESFRRRLFRIWQWLNWKSRVPLMSSAMKRDHYCLAFRPLLLRRILRPLLQLRFLSLTL